ncbi:hypothetical protein LZ30DRAFT_271241 [Colletotrichum cereale]|nr:hypothetical protein LZ30DRAFT_271241 [Colletotrichum cereale]
MHLSVVLCVLCVCVSAEQRQIQILSIGFFSPSHAFFPPPECLSGVEPVCWVVSCLRVSRYRGGAGPRDEMVISTFMPLLRALSLSLSLSLQSRRHDSDGGREIGQPHATALSQVGRARSKERGKTGVGCPSAGERAPPTPRLPAPSLVYTTCPWFPRGQAGAGTS